MIVSHLGLKISKIEEKNSLGRMSVVCVHIYQCTCYLLCVCIVVYVHTRWVVKFVLFVREPCNPCSNETDILRIVVVHTDRI